MTKHCLYMLKAEEDNDFEGEYAELMKCSTPSSSAFLLEECKTPSYGDAFSRTIGIPFVYSLLLSSAVAV